MVISFLFIGGCFFSYPDTVEAGITITTENPPAWIVARSTGKLKEVFLKDKQKVKAGELIGVVNNPADTREVLLLKKELEAFQINDSMICQGHFTGRLTLGEIQSAYTGFIKSLTEYRDFLKLDLYKEKEEAARRELNEYQIYISHLHNEVNLNKEELKLALSSYSREEILYKKGLVSASDYERSYQEGENNRNQFSVSASLSKGISWIKGYIFLDVAYSDSRSLLVRNDLKVPNTQRTWHIVPRLETDLFRWLTMKYKLNYAYSILALEDEETATRNISLNQQLSLRFSPFAKVSMELVAEHYHNESPTDRTRDFFLADFILSHKISSKWEIEVLAKNLMNEQRYVYTSFTDEASTVSRSYDIRPRNLMMTIKYSY